MNILKYNFTNTFTITLLLFLHFREYFSFPFYEFLLSIGILIFATQTLSKKSVVMISCLLPLSIVPMLQLSFGDAKINDALQFSLLLLSTCFIFGNRFDERSYTNIAMLYSIVFLCLCVASVMSGEKWIHVRQGLLRLAGPNGDPNAFGMACVTANIMLVSALILFDQKNLKNNQQIKIMKILIIFLILLTFMSISRTAIIATLFLMPILNRIYSLNSKIITVVICGYIISKMPNFIGEFDIINVLNRMNALFQDGGSGRFDNWQLIIKSLNFETTFTGFGAGMLQQKLYLPYDAHNSFITVLSELGVVPFCMLIIYFIVGCTAAVSVNKSFLYLIIASLILLLGNDHLKSKELCFALAYMFSVVLYLNRKRKNDNSYVRHT